VAADLAPTYKAAPAATPLSWSGLYLGGDIGGVFGGGAGTSNFFQSDSDPAFANNAQGQSPSPSAFTGGLHAGYNWQFAPAWVLGIEGDWQWTRPRYSFCRQTDIGSAACSDNGNGFANISSETRSIGTVRARIGQTFDRLMVYGTGGVAFADIKTTVGVNCLADGCGQSLGEIRPPPHSPISRRDGPLAAASNGCSARTGLFARNISTSISARCRIRSI
jgi:outer membrane immunogenic protein